MALGVAGLALIGALSTILTVSVLIVWGVLLAAIYALGKFLDGEMDDIEKGGCNVHNVD